MITAASLFAGVCRAPAASLPLAITDRTLPSVDGWGYYTSGVAVQVSLSRCRRCFVRFWKSQELCLKDQITQIAKTYLSFTPSGINCAVLVLMWQSWRYLRLPNTRRLHGVLFVLLKGLNAFFGQTQQERVFQKTMSFMWDIPQTLLSTLMFLWRKVVTFFYFYFQWFPTPKHPLLALISP